MMQTKAILATAVAAFAAMAPAQHNWILTSSYEYELDPAWNQPITHILAEMQGGAVDDSYGWGTAMWPLSSAWNPFSMTFTTDWFDPCAAQPFLRESLHLGIVQDLPGDAPGQKHLVLFMDPEAAANVQNIAWGTVFLETLEADVIEALEGIADPSLTEEEREDYHEFLGDFKNNAARQARVGPGGLEGSIWFAPGEFSIVAFSDGQTIGSGSNEFTTEFVPVPEPATMAVLGLGALALRRRRARR
jgi:hypothetical protein